MRVASDPHILWLIVCMQGTTRLAVGRSVNSLLTSVCGVQPQLVNELGDRNCRRPHSRGARSRLLAIRLKVCEPLALLAALVHAMTYRPSAAFAKQFWSDSDGVILPYVAIMLGVIIGLSALALDGSRLMSVQTQLQNGADALAVAGAAELDRRPDSIIRARAAIKT